MVTTMTKGNCYLCGRTLSKGSFKSHILSKHTADGESLQECALLKVEGLWEKEYWLYLDMPLTSTLKSLDSFLRDIWVECCGHMSAFCTKYRDDVGKSKKIGSFEIGTKLNYVYDFGSPTELSVTFVSLIRRPKQLRAVRLIARNESMAYTCRYCGSQASKICLDFTYDEGNPNPFICEDCMEKHADEIDWMLPVVNSPRMGVCGYEGEDDEFEFDSETV